MTFDQVQSAVHSLHRRPCFSSSLPSSTTQHSSLIASVSANPTAHPPRPLDDQTNLPLASQQGFTRRRRYLLTLAPTHDDPGRTSPRPRSSRPLPRTSYLSSAPWYCLLFYHPPSSYLPKTVRLTAKCLASSSQRRFVERSANRPFVRTRATTAMNDVTDRPLLLPRPATTSSRVKKMLFGVYLSRLTTIPHHIHVTFDCPFRWYSTS